MVLVLCLDDGVVEVVEASFCHARSLLYGVGCEVGEVMPVP